MVRVRLLGFSFRVCVTVVAVYGLLSLHVVLPVRVAETTLLLLWLCCLFGREYLFSRRCRILCSCQLRNASP